MDPIWHFIQEFWGLLFGASGLFATFMYYTQTKQLKNVEVERAKFDLQQERVNDLENRLALRDAKVDALYIELRKEQEARLSLVEEIGKVRLEAALMRCERQKCLQRTPPTGY